MIDINAYTEKLTNHLMPDIEDNIMECLEENAHEIINDALKENIRRCIAQAVQEAKDEVYHMISAAKPKRDFPENDSKSLVKRLNTICEESNVLAYALVAMDDEDCNVILNGVGINIIYMIRAIINGLTKNTDMSKDAIIAMLNVPFNPPIIPKK